MRNAALALIKVKMSGIEKKCELEEHIQHLLEKKGKLGCFWKFHVVVVQNNGKEMYKKGVLHVQSCFFAYETN